MVGMSRKSLRKCVDQARVVEAIRAAERVTSGEIRVSVAHFFWGDVEKTAGKAFHRLGMEKWCSIMHAARLRSLPRS